MFKEIKYLIYLLVIAFRGLESHKDKTITYAKNLPTLKNDTDKILTYVENNNTSKKKYKFWDLLDND